MGAWKRPPKSDQHSISPHPYTAQSIIEVKRKKKMIKDEKSLVYTTNSPKPNIIIGNVWENNVLGHNINPEIEN